MDELDRKIKELSADIHIPDDYDERLDGLLDSIPEKAPKPRRARRGLTVLVLAVFVLGIGFVLFGRTEAQANIFKLFGGNLFSFLGISDEEEELGVDSKKIHENDAPDLSIRLQELVVDEQFIYLNLMVTASPEIKFEKDVTFDYFGICRGESYSPDYTLGGARSCEMVGMIDKDENTAQYILSLSTDEKIEDGEPLVAFFQDLTRDPDGDAPETLVEGMWRIKFSASYTVSKKRNIDGTEQMKFPFLDSSARVKEISISPLGFTMKTLVKDITYDVLNVSDIRLELNLRLMDGSEMILGSRSENVTTDIEEGTISVDGKEGNIVITYVYEFKKPINVDMVWGMKVENIRISFDRE